MTPIRALERHEVPAVAKLYADFIGWRSADLSPFVEFFRDTLFDNPFADPEIPPLAYEDPEDGIVGFIGSNPRPFVHRSRMLRTACSGPLVVSPSHRQVLRAFAVAAFQLDPDAAAPQALVGAQERPPPRRPATREAAAGALGEEGGRSDYPRPADRGRSVGGPTESRPPAMHAVDNAVVDALQPHLLPHLWERGARLTKDCWALLKTGDPVLADAVLSGRSLLSRMEGEWWMRPTGTSALGSSNAAPPA